MGVRAVGREGTLCHAEDRGDRVKGKHHVTQLHAHQTQQQRGRKLQGRRKSEEGEGAGQAVRRAEEGKKCRLRHYTAMPYTAP